MARIPTNGPLPPQYDTSVYRQVNVGPRLLYTFEQQFGVPVDGGNPMLRDLSPFNIRLIPPNTVQTVNRNYAQAASSYVNAIGNVGQLTSSQTTKDNPLAIAAEAARTQRQVALSQSASPSRSGVFPTIYSGRPNQRQVRLADAYTALDIQNQTRALAQVPPLTLLVNPKNMEVSYTNVQSFTNRGRYGLIFQRWGENQPTISFSGSTGAFIAGADYTSVFSDKETPTPTGVQFASRRNSAAWQNFLAMFHFYRSNAYVYDTLGQSEAHLFIGAIAIDYDQVTYIGHIDSFDYAFDEMMPHRIEWNMNFVCHRIIDADTGSNRTNLTPERESAANLVVINGYGQNTVPTVAPIMAPTPSPSYPSRSMLIPNSGAGTRGGAVNVTVSPTGVAVSVSPDVQAYYSQTPLDLLTPGG